MQAGPGLGSACCLDLDEFSPEKPDRRDGVAFGTAIELVPVHAIDVACCFAACGLREPQVVASIAVGRRGREHSVDVARYLHEPVLEIILIGAIVVGVLVDGVISVEGVRGATLRHVAVPVVDVGAVARGTHAVRVRVVAIGGRVRLAPEPGLYVEPVPLVVVVIALPAARLVVAHRHDRASGVPERRYVVDGAVRVTLVVAAVELHVARLHGLREAYIERSVGEGREGPVVDLINLFIKRGSTTHEFGNCNISHCCLHSRYSPSLRKPRCARRFSATPTLSSYSLLLPKNAR